MARRPTLKVNYPSAEREIVSFIRRIVRDAGAKGVVLGLSGGIDSAVVGALCVKALGKERVTVLIMPSDFTPPADTEDAKALASNWGVKTYLTNISLIAQALSGALGFDGGKIPMANVQARVRMVLNYFVANSFGLLVAGTGDKSEDLLGYFCYDEMTRAVTTDGPKTMNELKRGDLVFSLNPKTLEVVEKPVDDIFMFEFSGKMIQFTGRGVDLMVTPNHRMLVQATSSRPDSTALFRSARDCLEFKSTLIPLPKAWTGNGEARKTIRIEFAQRHIQRTIEMRAEDALYVLGLFIGDGCATRGVVVDPVRTNLTRVEYVSLPRGGAGRFVPVESASNEVHWKAYDSFETTFALPAYTKDAARERLIAVLERYEIRYSLTPDTVRIPSKGIYDFFAQCGRGARNKQVPPWALQYPSHYLIHLLRGLKDSDASHAIDQNVYYTSSEQLKNDFVQLCFKLGRKATVGRRAPRYSRIKGKRFLTGGSYEISFASRQRCQTAIDNRLAKVVPYEGTVWCPSVPPYENLLVERNGRYLFCGNTKFGDGGVDFLPIAHLYKTQVRELGRSLGLPERVVNKPASPQLWPGQTAAQELPADYDRLDPLLYYLFDAKLSPTAAAKKAGVGADIARAVVKLHLSSAHKRRTPPMVKPW